MDKNSKILLRKLTSHFHYKRNKKGMTLLAYQLGVFFITELTYKDLKEDDCEWHFSRLKIIGDEFAEFMGVDFIDDKRLFEAKEVLIEAGFITQRKGWAKRHLIENEGYSDKKYWFWNVELTSFEFYN
jgi:hypothetical protein